MNDDRAPPYDLVIVGAGPAGATAALYACRRGLRAVLVDRDRFPRDKVCGDALSGKAVSVLDELGLLDGVRHLPGAAIRQILFGSPAQVDACVDLRRCDHRDPLTGRTLPMEGFVIRRKVFDHYLVEQARARGAEVREGFAVRDLLRDGNGAVVGVRGRGAGNGGEEELRGRVVLGCDGYNSIVARRLGLYEHDPAHTVVALRCYYEGIVGLADRIELHFVDEVLPGYFWVFPLDNGCANVGIGMLHRSIRHRGVNLKQALAAVIARPPFAARFAAARPLEEPLGWNLPVGSKHRPCCGAGYLLLGDAAGLIDPFTGEGIGNALYSARLAVEVAAQAIAAGDAGAAALAAYDRRLWEALGDELRVSARLQRLGRVRPLLNLVIRRAASDPRVSDHLCGMIANAVPKRQLTSPLYYLRLLLG